MEITFNLEGRDESAAFFALYAGLTMYHNLKKKQDSERNDGGISIAGLEAAALLEDLKLNHWKEYWESAAEYEHVYG